MAICMTKRWRATGRYKSPAHHDGRCHAETSKGVIDASGKVTPCCPPCFERYFGARRGFEYVDLPATYRQVL